VLAVRDLCKEGGLNTCLYICKYMMQLRRKGVSFELKRTGSLCRTNGVFVVHVCHQLCDRPAVLSGKHCCRRSSCCPCWLTVLCTNSRGLRWCSLLL